MWAVIAELDDGDTIEYKAGDKMIARQMCEMGCQIGLRFESEDDPNLFEYYPPHRIKIIRARHIQDLSK